MEIQDFIGTVVGSYLLGSLITYLIVKAQPANVLGLSSAVELIKINIENERAAWQNLINIRDVSSDKLEKRYWTLAESLPMVIFKEPNQETHCVIVNELSKIWAGENITLYGEDEKPRTYKVVSFEGFEENWLLFNVEQA